jgi:Flp pilus assembly protein TadD
MKERTLKNLVLVGMVGASALVAACGNSSGGKVEPPVESSNVATTAVPDTATVVPPPAPQPVVVDAETAKAARKDGIQSFDARDYSGAVDKLKTAVSGKPEDSYAHYLLGLAQWKSGDLAGAEISLTESVKLDGSRVKGWINLARVRNDRDDRNGAVEAADKALELDASSVDAMHQKGRALMELQRGDEALAILTEAAGRDTTNGYVANTLGLLLIQLGRPADAIAPLEVAKSVLPQVAYVRNNLGVAYERTGRLDDARAEYLAAVEAGDPDGKAKSSLARLGETGTTVTALSE